MTTHADRDQGYPYWTVEGRRFHRVDHARAFAERTASQQGRRITIMQRDDSMTPPFLLEVTLNR